MRSTDLIGQVDAEAIALSATFQLFSGAVDRYSALRFLMVFAGTGVGEIQLVWLLPDGTTVIQAAAEALTLAADYLEVPVRATNVTVNLVETGGANPITATGTAVGVKT